MAPRSPDADAFGAASSAPIVVRATVSRRQGLASVVGISFASLIAGSLLWRWSTHHPVFTKVGPLFFLAACVITVALGMRRAVRSRTEHEVHAGRAGISLDGVEIVARDRIRSAIVGLDRFGASVHVGVRGGAELVVGVRDVLQARAMVRALGFDARRTTATFRASSRVNESSVGAVGIVVCSILFGLFCWNPLYAGACGVVLFLGGLAMPTMVTVGTDGVLVRWAFERNYFSYADVARVDRMPGRVRLHLKSGKSFDVVFRSGNDRDAVEAGQLAERIVEAIERRDREGAPIDHAVLARPQGMDARAWVASLREIVRDETFRQAAITVDQLWGVLEDATATAATRAAAAIALRGAVDEKGRKRLRVAAQATAAPQLRVALERAADGEDAEIAEALEELEKGA